jgi:hypothetical protein
VPTETVVVWNLGFKSKTPPAVAKSRVDILKELVVDTHASLVALQEAPNSIKLPDYEHEIGPGGLLTAFKAATWSKTQRVDLLSRACGLGLEYIRTSSPLFLWNVHLPSALNGVSIGSRRAFVREHLLPEIHSARSPGRPELVVGDFNLPPYDEVLMARGGFWANRSLQVAEHLQTKAVSPRAPLFNPSWSLFAAHLGPCGTYYLTQQPDGEGPWHVVDQALLAPSLARGLQQHVRLVTQVRTTNLCSSRGAQSPSRRTGSDHLPLVVRFNAP